MDRRKELLMKYAHFTKDLASMSKCTQRGVAAIILNKDLDQVLSIGINGGPKGGLDCLCTFGDKYTCIHAEANAIAKLAPSPCEKVMILTLSPCVTCAALMVNANVKEVYYLEEWKSREGIALLKSCSVHTEALSLSPTVSNSCDLSHAVDEFTLYGTVVQAVTALNDKESTVIHINKSNRDILDNALIFIENKLGTCYGVYSVDGIIPGDVDVKIIRRR